MSYSYDIIYRKFHSFMALTFVLSGEILGFENLVYSVFEFVLGLLETPRFRGTVRKSCDQILYYMILYMQITEDQVSCYLFFSLYNCCLGKSI